MSSDNPTEKVRTLLNKQKKQQNSINQVFFTFLLVDGRIRIQEAEKHTDPEHWF
jgi:hypothetical protein